MELTVSPISKLIARWASPQLAVPLVTGAAAGAVVLTLGLLLDASALAISHPATPSQSLLVSKVTYLLAIPVGVALGRVLLRVLPRYIRTVTTMPQVISGADKLIVALIGAVLAIMVGNFVLGLRPTLNVDRYSNPVIAVIIVSISALLGTASALFDNRQPINAEAAMPQTVTGIVLDEVITREQDDLLAREGL